MLLDLRNDTRVCVWTRTFACVLTLFACALAYEAWQLGVTVDEPSHILSATLYWRGQDTLKPRDMPPLIKIAAGWAPHLLNPPYRTDGKAWAAGHEWGVSTEMMERFPPPAIGSFFFLSRLPMLLFPLLTAWLIWYWVRERAGVPAATFAAVIFALEPTALGHGAFFKNDLAATFTYLLFWFTAWRFWCDASKAHAAALGAALLAAVLAKLSMLVLIPVALLIVAVRAIRLVLLVAAIVYFGAVAACQFELELTPLIAGLPVPVPAPLWQGAWSLAANNAHPAPVFLDGRLYDNGTPLYFLLALAWKVPISLQILIAIGLWKLPWRSQATAFLALPPALYIGLASFSGLQMGIRLILPALPFGVLIAAEAIKHLWARPRWAVHALMIVLAAETASVYPHGLTFFNLWAGGPENGVAYLTDSNVDWGQSLGDVQRYAASHGIRQVSLAYFGMDQPSRYFTQGSYEFLIPPWGAEWVRGTRLVPQKGRYYAVSAGLLAGHLFAPPFRDYYAEFRKRKPIAMAGSMRLYRFD